MRSRESIIRTLQKVETCKRQQAMLYSGVEQVARESEAEGVKQVLAFLDLVIREDADPAVAEELMNFEQRLQDGEL